MKRWLKVYMYGLLISFLGTLPFGTLNITAFHLSASKSVSEAFIYVTAVVLVELIVVRLTLMGDSKINFEGKWSFYVLPLGVLLLMYLAISSFISLSAPQELRASANLFPAIQSSFLLGLLLSVLNPMHIPFWIGWNRFLIAKKTLDSGKGMYASYILGIGLGSLGAFMIFIFAGKYIFQNYEQYSFIITFALGLLYLGFSFYLLFLIYKRILKLKIQ
ncbi:LysE family transporter [Spongiimicrobium salis]|uniref:LysE family transporter n=1 Tax=Spongiimicrobium salis TaxID=1667022 RepID=UPI00374CEA41